MLVGSVRIRDDIGVAHGVNDEWCGYGEARVSVDGLVTATASYIVDVVEPRDVGEAVETDEDHLTHVAKAQGVVLMVVDRSLDLQVEESSRWLVYCGT